MKKLFFTFLFFACLLFSAHAQTEKGVMLIGGSGNFHYDTKSSTKAWLATATPRAGFFIANNMALGAAIPLSYSTGYSQESISIGFTPFMRGYVGSSPTKLLLEGRGGFNYISGEIDIIIGNGVKDFKIEDSEKYFSFGIGAGIAHFLNEHVALELTLNYDKANLSSYALPTRGLEGISLNLGFQIHLPGSN